MSVTNTTVKTSHADIAIAETSGKGLPVVFIHGNSACKEVFGGQLNSVLGDRYRLIAVDLPGHGASSNAFEPERSYTMPGYADAVVEVLATLGIDQFAIVGWSLGGHVALEMLPRCSGVVGLMLCGAPPVSPTIESLQSGFLPNPLTGLLGKEVLTEDEVSALADACYGKAVNAGLMDAMRRTDGRARTLMFQGLFAGNVSDQRELAEKSDVPVAMVNGAEDPFVNVDYVSSLSYANLWDRHCFILRGAGHTPFLAAADTFDGILVRFVDEMAARARTGKARGGHRHAGAAA